MRALYWVLSLVLFTFALGCENDDEHEQGVSFTGRSIEYPLLAGSEYDTSGKITFKERKDKSLQAVIQIGPSGMEGYHHPAHLHYGVFEMDAPMAAMLHPVDGITGEGVTERVILEDDTILTFEALQEFDGHIKVHGDDGPEKDLILAYANIGKNKDKPITPPSFYTVTLCR